MSPQAPVEVETFEAEVLLRVLSDVKGGDFSARMPVDWTGVAGQIAAQLNDIIGANEALGTELERVSRVVGEKGELPQRVAVDREAAPARRLTLLDELKLCVEHNELVLHYQPKVDLRTRETVGVEALIRWNHPSGKLLMPGDFMPEVERNDLMISITDWVVEEALRQLGEWRNEGYDLTVAINLGARSLAPGTTLFETLDRLTSASSIPPAALTLELREAALLEIAEPVVLAELGSREERLSIDDVGTSHSALTCLQRWPLTEIKADRSLVTNMCDVESDALIVRSIVEMAHKFGAKVVAEGVEDKATLDRLVDFGCDEAQGYFFSRPVPGHYLTSWLTHSDSFGLSPRLDRSTAEAVHAGDGLPLRNGSGSAETR